MSDIQTPPAIKLPRAKPAAKGVKGLPAKAALNAGVSDEAVAAELLSETTPKTEEPTMDTATIDNPTTTTTTATEMAADMQDRAKAAFDKTSAMTADITAFHKGTIEAMLEAGKLFAAGMQDLGRTAVEDAKSAAETVTADARAMAAVTSPTELVQLQGDIMRRNLDTLVQRTSHNAEAMMKLANDVFAPLSTRASVAMERFTKAA